MGQADESRQNMAMCKKCGSPMFGGACMKCNGKNNPMDKKGMKPSSQGKGKGMMSVMGAKRGK